MKADSRATSLTTFLSSSFAVLCLLTNISCLSFCHYFSSLSLILARAYETRHGSVGFGDICPGHNVDTVGTLLLTVLPLVGLGFFCGPVLSIISSCWQRYVVGIRSRSSRSSSGGYNDYLFPFMSLLTVLAISVAILVLFEEDMSLFQAIHLSIITGSKYCG